jgi:Flp pilus assembly protein TadD
VNDAGDIAYDFGPTGYHGQLGTTVGPDGFDPAWSGDKGFRGALDFGRISRQLSRAMDQLTAHLDRGWDLAQKGDIRGAESSARRAIELSPESAEAHNLLGYVASLEGDCEEAVEAYQQAIALDDTYVEAMLNAAELYVHPLAEYEQAIDLCDRVLDLSDYDDETTDALLLKFEALWGKGEDDEAKEVLKRLPQGPFDDPSHNFLAGRAFFEVGERERAKPLIAKAVEVDPGHAEAHYYLGLLAEGDNDHRGASLAFLRVRQLEIEAGLPPWSPNEETFMMFVERAAAELPAELGTLLESAELYVVDMPGPEMVADGVDVHALALVDAVRAKNGAEGELSLRVFLYAINLLRTAGALHLVQGAVKEALERELRAALEDLGGGGAAN